MVLVYSAAWGNIHRPSLTTGCTDQAAQAATEARDQLMGTGTGQSGPRCGCPRHNQGPADLEIPTKL